jgi:hypothetical protein
VKKIKFHFLFTLLSCISIAGIPIATAEEPALNVYKSPTCGCCVAWIEHAENAGFHVTTHHPSDLDALKSQLGVANQHRSCHTAVNKNGYLFEGHVPAKFVQQFLENPPEDAIGLAVPGMPVGSPGMEMNNRFNQYKVILLKKNGDWAPYAEINAPSDQY